MSKTFKDQPRKHRKDTDRTEYKRHGGMMARNYAGYGGLKCPCCSINDDSYKKTDRQEAKQIIQKALEDNA